jgi:hypothetical protein
MELERQGMIAGLECLMRADIGGGQVHRAFRQIEDVAMPVQHRQSRQRPHHIPACPGQGKRLPSDLLGGPGIDPRTQRPRHQLGTKTDAQHRARRCQAPRDKGDFIRQIRDKAVPHRCRSARPAQPAGRDRKARDINHAHVGIADVIAGIAQRLAEAAQILERQMADCQKCLGHRLVMMTKADAVSIKKTKARY